MRGNGKCADVQICAPRPEYASLMSISCDWLVAETPLMLLVPMQTAYTNATAPFWKQHMEISDQKLLFVHQAEILTHTGQRLALLPTYSVLRCFKPASYQ